MLDLRLRSIGPTTCPARGGERRSAPGRVDAVATCTHWAHIETLRIGTHLGGGECRRPFWFEWIGRTVTGLRLLRGRPGRARPPDSMRVLLVDSGREWRGGQNQVRLLARELVRVPDIEARLATRRASELARRVREYGIGLREVPWRASLDPRALCLLALEIARFRPALIHAHDSHALQLAHWARRLAARGARAPLLVGTRRVVFHVRPRSVWFRVDHVIAVSEAVTAVLLADGMRAEAISLVRDGIDTDEVRRAAAQPIDIRGRLGLPSETPLAVSVAALADEKDHCTLIRAAQAARVHQPQLHWVIAGEGPLRPSLERDIARLELGDCVHLLGYVTEADALIREANVFVMSSKSEGLGSVVLQALALGIPVVATRAGGLPEIVPSAALVPTGDAEALACAVGRALDRPCPVSLPRQCTAAAMARGVLGVYRSLLPRVPAAVQQSASMARRSRITRSQL
jgi:L-malate glycosyltransferase